MTVKRLLVLATGWPHEFPSALASGPLMLSRLAAAPLDLCPVLTNAYLSVRSRCSVEHKSTASRPTR